MEKEEGTQSFPCGNADESRTHIAGECELYREGRDVLEEDMRKVEGCGIEKLDTLDSVPRQ